MIRRLLGLPLKAYLYLKALTFVLRHRAESKRFSAATTLCWFCDDSSSSLSSLCPRHRWEAKTLMSHGTINPLYWEWWPRGTEVTAENYVPWDEREPNPLEDG